MKLELVTGSNIYEATCNVFKRIDKTDLNTNYFIVVPDRFTLKAEEMLFDALNISASFNIDIQSLTGFSQKVLNFTNRKTIPSSMIEGVLTVKEIMENHRDELLFYKKFTTMFCYEMYKNIMQFKSSNLKAKDVKYVGKKETLKNKFHDIAIIFEEYELKMKDKVDSSDLLSLCSADIENSSFLDGAEVAFVGFDSFTENNLLVFRSALRKAKKVMVAISRPVSLGNAYIYEDDILDKVRIIAKEEKIEPEVISPESSLNKAQSLVAKNLFSYNVQSMNLPYLSVYSSNSQKEEVGFVANQIKYKIYKGERFKNFSIACSDLEEYAGVIEEVFTQYKIPYYIDLPQKSEKSALFMFISKILSLKKKNFLTDDLLYILNSPLLKIEDEKALITFVNEHKISGKKGFLKYLKSSLPQIDGLVSALDNATTLKEYVCVIRQSLVLTSQGFESYLEQLERGGFLKERTLEEQMPEKIENLLKELEENDKAISFADFVSLFNLGCSLLNISALPAFCDAVFVGDATTSFFGETKNMFVLGATRGKLPRVMADNAMLSDAELEEVSFKNKIEPTIRMINRRNRFKLFCNLLTAKESLNVSYLAQDKDGKLSEKAMFVSLLMQIFNLNIDYSIQNLTYFGSNKDFERFLFTTGGNYETAKLALMGYLSNREVPREYVGSLQQALECDFEKFYLNRDKINIDDKLKLFFPATSFSVSQMERFFDCPFKHFVDYGLRLKEKESVEIEKNELGSFVHDLLRAFVEKFKTALGDVSHKEISDFVSGFIKNFNQFQKLEFSEEKDIILKSIHKDSLSVCEKIVKEAKHSQFKPNQLEFAVSKKFGSHSSNLSLFGRIDRVDEFDGKYFRVIDYKTGNISKDFITDLYYGKKLQLVLYSNVIKEKTGLKPGGLYYFNAQSKYEGQQKPFILQGVTLSEKLIQAVDTRLKEEGVLKSDVINAKRTSKGIVFSEIKEKDFEKVEDYANKLSSIAINQILEGNIKAIPEENSCKYCKYRGVCLYDLTQGTRKHESKSIKDLTKEGGDE